MDAEEALCIEVEFVSDGLKALPPGKVGYSSYTVKDLFEKWGCN